MDCCAQGRKLSSGRTASPSMIARQMANMALGRMFQGERRTIAVFCFDSSRHHHPMREVCSQKRYKPPTPASLARNQSKLASGEMVLVGGRLFKSYDAPYTNGEIASFTYTDNINWTKLFNSGFGKKRAWLLLEEALENYLGSIAGTLHDGTPIDSLQFVIDGSNGTHSRFLSKGRWKTKPSITTYGEADLKLQVWSERIIGNEHALLITIDSDSIAIAMLNNVGVTIELSKVWQAESGAQFYSLVTAKRNQCSAQYTELVQIPNMNPETTPFQRTFCVLAAGGCDYSSGLLGFGISREALISFARDGFDEEDWLYREDNRILINAGRMLNFLQEHKIRKARKTQTVEKFCLETHRLLWTILYWSGCGRKAEPAGPPTDMGLDDGWLCLFSQDTSTVEKLLDTAESSSVPICIGTL